MGVDVEIECRNQDPANLQRLVDHINNRIVLSSFTVYPGQGYNVFIVQDSTTASFCTMWRYWGIGYERGPWFEIYGIIMLARSIFGADNVYYGCDHEPSEEYSQATDEYLSELWQHYLSSHGDDYRIEG